MYNVMMTYTGECTSSVVSDVAQNCYYYVKVINIHNRIPFINIKSIVIHNNN